MELSTRSGCFCFFFGGLKCRREMWWDMVTYDVTSHDFFSQNGWFRIGGMLKKHYFYLLEIGSCCFRYYVYIISARVLSFCTIVFFSSFCSILRKLFCSKRRRIIESRWKWKMGCLQYSCPLFGVISTSMIMGERVGKSWILGPHLEEKALLLPKQKPLRNPFQEESFSADSTCDQTPTKTLVICCI